MRGLLVVLSLCLVMVFNLSISSPCCVVVHGFVTATTTARSKASENTTYESFKRRCHHRYHKHWHRGSFSQSGLDATSCGRRNSIVLLRAASSNGISGSFGISNSYLQSLDEQTNNKDDTSAIIANDEQGNNKTTEETTTKKTGISVHAASQVTYEHTFWGSTCHTKEEIQTFCQQAMNEVQEQYHGLIHPNKSSGTFDPLPVVNVLHTDPPLILIEDMLSSNQCESLVRAVATPEDSSSKFQRSTTGASQETSDIRTSTTTWLRENQGSVDSQELLFNQKNDENAFSPSNNNDNNQHQLTMRYLSTAVSALTGLPTCHQENLQMIQYTKGQQFEVHTDHLDSFNEFHFGGRLATCLVYLNSDDNSITTNTSSSSFSNNNEGSSSSRMTSSTTFTGGETYFPYLDISVRPQRGSALLFWNTKERPGMKHYTPNMFLNVDERLCHSGMPVTNTNGIKWACNRWIHPVDYGAGVRGL